VESKSSPIMSDNATETNVDGSRGKPTEADHYVLGGGSLGLTVAQLLREEGHTVTLVDETVESTDCPTVEASPTDLAALRAAGVTDASTVIVAARSDRRNLLVAQLVRTQFDGPRVIVLANAVDRVDAFADAGHETVCVMSALGAAVAERV
jgi:trk system potassium uptake protein TrkA